MELKQAVEVIKGNWPDERYTMLREALTVVLEHLPTSDNSDYAKCEHKNVSWVDGKWFCEDCKRPVIVTAHFA